MTSPHQRLGLALRVARLRERSRRAALLAANDAVDQSAAAVERAASRITTPPVAEQSTSEAVRLATVDLLRAAAVRSAQHTHAATVLDQRAAGAQWESARARADRLGERYQEASAQREYLATIDAQRETDDAWPTRRAAQ